ncbi:MAG: hypothetical protein E7557_05635 [Ruminococcaceae bacterium]|nr:hypothetical protein [Oscillospiraceae bacterium]
MKFHFKGIYKGKEHELDYLDEYYIKEHKPNAIEIPKRKKFFELKCELLSCAHVFLFSFILCLRYPLVTSFADLYFFLIILTFFCLLSIILLPVHEILHTIFNKQDSFFYLYPKHFCAFVMNIEEKTKFKKILGFLLPSVILGIIPFIIAIIFPQLKFLGFFAIPNIAWGSGDYMDTFHFLRYVPNGARIYSHKDGIYWYKPE